MQQFSAVCSGNFHIVPLSFAASSVVAAGSKGKVFVFTLKLLVDDDDDEDNDNDNSKLNVTKSLKCGFSRNKNNYS